MKKRPGVGAFGVMKDADSGGPSTGLPDQGGDQGANACQGGLQRHGQQVDRGGGRTQLDQGGAHHKGQKSD